MSFGILSGQLKKYTLYVEIKYSCQLKKYFRLYFVIREVRDGFPILFKI